MVKTLVLIRHAHRDTSARELDNGLDEKGREQAKCIKRFFADRFQKGEADAGLWLVSSPKLRCVETLNPLAKALEREVDVHPGLDEQSFKESSEVFEKRVATFLAEWAKSPAALTVLCSHGDWLPLATQRLMKGLNFDFRKGAWVELEWDTGVSTLKWCIPSFKTLYK